MNGTGDTAVVDSDGALCAAAWNFWVAEESARARVGSGEHEKLAGVGHASGGAGERDGAVFDRLAKGLDAVVWELGDFVENEDAAMGERDLPGKEFRSSTNDSRE